jgi:hypothetical protein
MTCGHRHATLRLPWTCVRYAGHPEGEHRYTTEPAAEDEPHINTDWQELAP